MTGHDINYTSTKKVGIKGFTETQQHRLPWRAEQWAFDNCRHLEHQFCRAVGIGDAGAQRVVQFTPGGAAGVQQGFPTQFANSAMQKFCIEPVGNRGSGTPRC